MRLDHPTINTEMLHFSERELRGAAERRRLTAGVRVPLRDPRATLGSWLRVLADRLDPAAELNRGTVA